MRIDGRRQRSGHHRRNWARERGLDIPHTTHYQVPIAQGDSIADNQKVEFDLFRNAIADVETSADFVVIDTPGFDTNLNRLAHSLADTLITPLNDSLIDLDVMAHVDAVTGEPRELSHYARLVQRARRERLAIDGQTIDWVLLRNRISMLSSRNMRQVQSGLELIATRLCCRVADGIAERVIFRSLFPSGMPVFDSFDDELSGLVPSMAHLSARQEYRQLVDSLNLPTADRAHARRAAKAAFEQSQGPRFPHMATNAS